MTLFDRLAWDLRAAVRARLIYLARPSRAMATRRLDLVEPAYRPLHWQPVAACCQRDLLDAPDMRSPPSRELSEPCLDDKPHELWP